MIETINNPMDLGLSSEELYALARKKQEQEAAAKEEEAREQIRLLREQRREMVRRHRKERADLDRQIAKLGGKLPKSRVSRASGNAGPSQVICEIVASEPEMTIGEIRARALAAGLNVKNLSQTLGYLKKQGRLEPVRRGVYRAL
ncbi:hypothetical protein SAMN05421693_10596 [Ectothiorhodospira magna]|uniref:Uncharacterized protein n=1 Tax=Ectothiorhodospira magna TaxID=867345 RepID=A0A1H9AJM0_9GAMM|nr:hypothetical protein [Ectothiorhodospira magna]SEP76661.1 hypothetical protein SAMN05421693_10596 [Ectothiorhodospira magna]